MAGRWKDVQGRILINFLVSWSRGVYFVSSEDVTDAVEDHVDLFKILDVVEEVGEKNVVQVQDKGEQTQHMHELSEQDLQTFIKEAKIKRSWLKPHFFLLLLEQLHLGE